VAIELFLVALGAMKITEFAKELIPWPVEAWVKSAFSLVTAGVLGFVVGAGPVEILGAWGGAALCHEIRSVLSLNSDDKKQQIILRQAGRRR
jgi:hypothetical protein